MKVLILTQEDPFYLADNIKYLLDNLSNEDKVVGCVVFDVSPFGKKESFLKKMKKTLNVFGLNFFIHYGFNFFINKLNPNKKVSKVLRSFNIPIIKLEKGVNHEDSLKLIQENEPDLLISIAGNQIFRKKLINLAPKGCLNLHTALLPKYRGLMPSFWVLKNNEKETGVSVFFVDEGIDSGPILVQKHIPIENGLTQAELIKKSKKIGMDAILESIDKIREGNFELLPNDDNLQTYYTFPTRNDVIEFKKQGGRFY